MRKLVLGIAAMALSACGEVVPIETDAAVDAQEIDAVEDICAKNALSVDEFFTCLSRAVCTVYSDCIGSDTSFLDCDEIPINVFGDLRPTAAKVVIAQAVAAGRTQWNPTAAKQCVSMLTEGGCRLFKNDQDVFALCGALTGAVNNGQLCQNDIECATPGAQCVVTPGLPGTNQCVDYTCRAPVPAGMACTGGAFCRPEDHCVYRLVGGTDMSICATGDAGQACDRDDDCDVGNFCNGGLSNGSAMGICTLSKQVGATCRSDDECAGELACVGNFGAVNGICRDVRAPNAICDANTFPYSCHGHQVCETPGSNMTGTCKPAANLGQACNVMNGVASYCGFFMSCENNLCREPGALNEACTVSTSFGGGGFGNPNGCNMGLFCDIDVTGQPTGVCRLPQANNSSCSRDSNCDSDFCAPATPRTCQTYPTCSF
jgi:hypothetical protein